MPEEFGIFVICFSNSLALAGTPSYLRGRVVFVWVLFVCNVGDLYFVVAP